MLRNRMVIVVIVAALVLVAVYDVYYFGTARQRTGSTEIENADARRPVRRLPAAGRERMAAMNRAAPRRAMEFDEILDRIYGRNTHEGSFEMTLDPFRPVPDEPVPQTVAGVVGKTDLEALDLSLTAVFTGGTGGVAIINEHSVRLGDLIEGAEVTAIGLDGVELRLAGETRRLSVVSGG